MISQIIAFLVMLNPFALFLYLNPVMEELEHKNFLKVLFKATIISFGIFLIFLFTGKFVFEDFFQINFESFRIFGGIVIFSLAYLFIVKGQKAMIHMKGSLDDLASEIALPFMIGAGTISLTILMANELPIRIGLISLIIILAINYIFILILKAIRDNFERNRMKVAFDKNMDILLRLNGFFVGAIGINMVLTAINNMYF